MIIECPACRTRFRLDEARIKGRGARVRCRRCGESIVVLKPKEQQPADAGQDTLDLRSAADVSLEDRVPPPPAPSGFRSDAGKDEIDLAFDKLLVSGRPEDSPPAKAAPGEPADLAIDFRPDEKVDLTGAKPQDLIPEFETLQGTDPRLPTETLKEEAAAESAASDFLVSDADTLDLLKNEYRKEKEEEAQVDLDISGSLRPEPAIPIAPAEVPEPALRASSPAPDVEEPSPFPQQDYEAQLQEAALPEVDSVPPPPPPETSIAKETLPPKPQERREAASRFLRPSLIALLLVFLALSGGGAYLGFTKGGQDILRGLFPGMESLWLRGGKSVPQLDVRNPIGYFERDANAGDLFIIKGQVVNAGRARKSAIRIRAGLLDDREQTIGETSCYAGNVLSAETLRTATREKIEETLSNRFGEQLVNMEIPPGKSVPFMVVFFDAPDGISAYRLEAKEGD